MVQGQSPMSGRFWKNDPACMRARRREAAIRASARLPILRQYPESRVRKFLG